MYGYVWKWAGTYRKTNKNIGVEAYLISTELYQLLGDARYWLEHKTTPPLGGYLLTYLRNIQQNQALA
jgi:fido (protein-threonine AMPylation protein)